jgi:hypothetical protein
VRPASTYRYAVARTGIDTTTFTVHVPTEGPAESLSAARGKGLWLQFSPDSRDDDAYVKLEAIADQATRAGLRYLELRMAYGEFWEVTPAAKPVFDALIDAAAAEASP